MKGYRWTSVAPLLLASALLMLLPILLGSLQQQGQLERVAAARVAVESIASTIARARLLGVPADGLVGLDELRKSRLPADSGVTGLRLATTDGRTLWQDGVAPAKTASTSTYTLIDVSVGDDMHLSAGFSTPGESRLVALKMAAVVLLVAAALMLPLVELARFLDTRNDRFSREYYSKQLQALETGDYRTIWWPIGVRDARLAQLRDMVLLVDEQYKRLVRLVRSLQRTEPHAGRRGELDATLEAIDLQLRFVAGAPPEDRRVWPEGETARFFAMLAMMLAGLSFSRLAESPTPAASLAAGALGMLLAVAATRRAWSAQLLGALAAAAAVHIFTAFDTRVAGWAAAGAGGLTAGLAFGAAARARSIDGGPLDAVRLLILAAAAGFGLGVALTTTISRLSVCLGAAGLAALCAAALAYLLPISHTAPSRDSLRPTHTALWSGAAFTTAALTFTVRASDEPTTALLLLACALPGLVWMEAGFARVPLMLALAAATSVSTLWPSLLGGAPEWLGAAALAGSLPLLRRPDVEQPARLVAGLACGALAASLTLAAAAAVLPPAGAEAWAGVQLLLLLGGTAIAWRREKVAGRH